MKKNLLNVSVNFKTYFNYNNKKILLSKSNFKNFFFFLKIFLFQINNLKKKNYNIINFFNFNRFSFNIKDFYNNFLYKKKKNFFKHFYTFFFLQHPPKKNYTFAQNTLFLKNKEIIKNFLKIKKKFYLFKNFSRYHIYWSTIFFKDGKIYLINKNFFQKVRNIWPIIEINDEVTRYRLDIDDGIGNYWLIYTIYQKMYFYNKKKTKIFTKEMINKMPEIIKAENKLIEMKKIQKEKSEKVLIIKENSKIKVKKRLDKVIELQENIYNRLMNKKFSNIYLTTNKINILKKFNILYLIFRIIDNFYKNKNKYKMLKRILKFFYVFKHIKNNLFKKIILNKHNRMYFKRKWYKNKVSAIYIKNNIKNKKILYIYFFKKKIKKKVFFKKNILKKNTFIDFKKIFDLKLHLLCIYNLTKKTPINNKKMFYFTSFNLIFNMNFFYQYQFERWILHLIFCKINGLKWFKVYFSNKLNITKNISNFFNLKKFLLLNIVKPSLQSTKIYKILLIESKKNKTRNITKIFLRIITIYFFKLFKSAYSIIFSKFTLKLINRNIRNFLNLLSKSIKFELIRANFIFEFINICTLTFLSKDPKFLIKWIVKVLHKISFKKHWKFLYLLKSNILKISNKLINKTNLQGFHITVRGKIGSTGSVRKKILHIRDGKYGFSKYYNSGDVMYMSVTTQTGKIGLKMVISYN